MSEQEHNSQLSALFDNQLPHAQADLVIRRVLKDPALHATWGHYSLIGACLRNEPVGKSRQADVAGRVRLLLASEAAHPEQSAPVLAGQGRAGRHWALGRGALGGAIAAGVAVLSLFVFRSIGPQAASPAMQQMAQATVPAAITGDSHPLTAVPPVNDATQVVANDDSALPSYTTPVDNSPSQRIRGQLVNLVVAHSEGAASSIPVTALMGNYDIAQGAVEMTEAQIGDYR